MCSSWLASLRLFSELLPDKQRISGLVVEYIIAIDVTRVQFPADAPFPSSVVVCWVLGFCCCLLGFGRSFCFPIKDKARKAAQSKACSHGARVKLRLAACCAHPLRKPKAAHDALQAARGSHMISPFLVCRRIPRTAAPT